MSEQFAFNARQYFDFTRESEDFHNDSQYFANDEDVPISNHYQIKEFAKSEENLEELSGSSDSDNGFFSPMESEGIDTSGVFLRSKLRRSLSLSNIKPEIQVEEDPLRNSEIEYQPQKSSSSYSLNKAKAASRENLSRLAQPKRFTSEESVSLAEAVKKFQTQTPKRFRSKPSPHINKFVPIPWGGTRAHSPKLMTTQRARPVSAISKEEKELQELEEAKKFQIRAHPVNRRVLKGPLKPQIEKKPTTVFEPFNLTEVHKKAAVDEPKASAFHAKPTPKSLHHPFQLRPTSQPITKPQTPEFSKRLTRRSPKIEMPSKHEESVKPFKPTRTQPIPFSFEKRDQDCLKKKEELIKRVMEEEKKAREFHAKPPPKSILRSRNNSANQLNDTSAPAFKKSNEELEKNAFKARPASILNMKPFIPKKDESHILQIEAFQFTTDQRAEARHKFEQQLKEKEELMAAVKKEREEEQRRKLEEEVAKARRETEYKAQPIRKYKEIIIKPANKVTEPISPNFHTDRIRNKENMPTK